MEFGSRLKFHIVVTPGSARLATRAVASLVRHSSFRFCLVGNGLSADEVGVLEQFARATARVTTWHVPERSVLPHGIVLNRLFREDADTFFCFADADVFATDRLDEPIGLALRGGYAAVTAGYHLVLDPEEDWPGFEGKRLRGPQGETLGVTFFAIYRRDLVEQVAAEYNVLFERYEAFEQLPPKVQAKLGGGPYAAPAYDTAKVLNILLHLHGHPIAHLNLPSIVHIGGLCGALMPSGGRLRALLRRYLPQRPRGDLDDAALRPPIWRRLWWRFAEPSQRRDRWGTYARERAAAFFAQYVLFLEGRAAAPVLAVRDPRVRHALEQGMFALREALVGRPADEPRHSSAETARAA